MDEHQPIAPAAAGETRVPAAGQAPPGLLPYGACFLVFAAYLLLRAVVWQNTTLLEDSDSLSYLLDTEELLRFDLHRIIDLGPDSSLFYPLLSAIFCLPGWSTETGARLASFASGILLFLALFAIGRRLGKPAAIIPGMLLLAFNPDLVSLAPAVLTEPSYIAVVYLGLWLFWIQYKNPEWRGAALLGLIFGLAFLNRLEGILFVAFVPLMLLIYYLWRRPENFGWQRVAGWSLTFLLCFSLLAGLQVWRVSSKMNTFAINGRQVWTLLLHADIGDDYHEKIYGLNFSPSRINIGYLQENGEAMQQIGRRESGFGDLVRSYTRTIITNAKSLYYYRLSVLIGIFGLVFFAFGLLALHQARRRFEIFLILSFILTGLTAPLLHNVVIRHILVVAPIILLVAGFGIDFLTRSLLADRTGHGGKRHALAALFLLLVFASWTPQLRDSLDPPAGNPEYSPAELNAPVAVLRRETAGWQHPPLVAARKGYLAYYADADALALPYTDYQGLLLYSRLNEIDFLYLNHELIHEFPFLNVFLEGGHTADFHLLYQWRNARGQLNELYRFTGKQGPPVRSPAGAAAGIVIGDR